MVSPLVGVSGPTLGIAGHGVGNRERRDLHNWVTVVGGGSDELVLSADGSNDERVVARPGTVAGAGSEQLAEGEQRDQAGGHADEKIRVSGRQAR